MSQSDRENKEISGPYGVGLGEGGGEHPQIDAMDAVSSPEHAVFTSAQLKHPAFIAVFVQSALGQGGGGGHIQEVLVCGGSCVA